MTDAAASLTGKLLTLLCDTLHIDKKVISVENHGSLHVERHIRTLSQFASEAKVLFPPCTMLAVLSNRGADRAESDSCGVRSIRTISEGDKRFACIDVLPTFV